MSRIFKFLCSLFVLLVINICTPHAYASGSFDLTLEKSGQLSKHIKKGDVLNVKSLSISGPINNEDLSLIFSMSNLEVLDLKNAVLSDEKYDIKKGRDFYDDHTLKFGNLPKLKKLTTSIEHYNLANITALPSLKYLAVYDGDLSRRFKEDNISLTLDTIALLSSRDYKHQPSEYDLRYYTQTGGSELESYAERLIQPIKANVLISEVDGMSYVDHRNIAANIIKIPGYTILYHWSPELTENQIKSIDVLAPYSFVGANISKLTIPPKVKKLPSFLGGVVQYRVPLATIAKFKIPEINSYIEDLKSKYDSEDVKQYMKIQEYPLYSKIEELDLSNIEDIDAHALDGFVIQRLTLPPTLKYFNQEAFENNSINEALFTSNAAPIVYENNHDITRNYLSNTGTKFIAPKGKIDKFRIGPWGSLNNGYWSACLFEDGNDGTFEITLEEPGTLDKHITDANALNIESLKIKGLLYDTDFEAINKCKNLRVLDLRQSFPSLSPETLSKNKKTAEALMGLLGLAFEGAASDTKSKYENGNGSFVEANYYQALNDRFKKIMNEKSLESIKSDPACILPENAFKGLRFLIAIAYPSQMETLKNGSLHSDYIVQIILPSNLKKLNAHIGGPRLQSITIPSSVKEIGRCVFSGSENLEELDLRNTKVEKIAWSALYECPNLQNFYGSPVLKSFERDDYRDDPELNVGWFYTKEMPYGLNYFKVIHIPEGYSAAYTSIDSTVIDDIKE